MSTLSMCWYLRGEYDGYSRYNVWYICCKLKDILHGQDSPMDKVVIYLLHANLHGKLLENYYFLINTLYSVNNHPMNIYFKQT